MQAKKFNVCMMILLIDLIGVSVYRSL